MPKICRICVNNDLLCSACSARLASGEISQVEVSLSRALSRLSIGADFVRAVDLGMVYILADKRNARLMIGRSGKNSKNLEAALDKKIRIIENTDEKDAIESVLGSDIIGINVLYTPKEKYRIRVKRLYRNRIKSVYATALGALFGKDYEIIFE